MLPPISFLIIPFFCFLLSYLSSLQLQTSPKHPENPENPRISKFHLLRRLNTKSVFSPSNFQKPQASVNTTFSKTPFFLKNPVGFPSTLAFSYQTPLRCGKLGKFHFYDDLWGLFRPFFKTCSRNHTFSRFSPDFPPLFPVSSPFFYLQNPPFSEKPRSTNRTSPPPFPPENSLFSSNYFHTLSTYPYPPPHLSRVPLGNPLKPRKPH